VHVDLADGRRLTKRVDYPLGNAKNRLKDSAVEGKFLALVERIIGESRAKKITELVWNLDEAKNEHDLMQALQVPEEK
jgi:2-methylcitrate dehydratase PrpD